MCQKHRNRRRDILKKILENVDKDDETGCWNWRGSTSGENRPTGGGYGRIAIGGTTMAVHRVVWTHFYGIIPHKKQIDHLCGNRRCCNPDHLELVTHKENCKRRDKKNGKKT